MSFSGQGAQGPSHFHKSSLNLKESSDSKNHLENLQPTATLIPPIQLIKSLSNTSNEQKDIEAELLDTTNRMQQIREKLKEDILNQTSQNKKEVEKELFEEQMNKMTQIYQQQITVLEHKTQVLDNEKKYLIQNYTEKIQMLEDENQRLLKDLQEKSHDTIQLQTNNEEYKVLIDQYQEERLKNNEKVKNIDEGYKFMETELIEAREKSDYFLKQKNKYKRERNEARVQLQFYQEENQLLNDLINKCKEENQFLHINLKETEQKLTNYELTEQNYADLQTKYISLNKQSDEDSSLIQQYESDLKQIQHQFEVVQTQYQTIILEKNANENRYLKQIQDLEEAIEGLRFNLQKSEGTSTKNKKKLTENQSIIDSLKIQVDKYEKLEEIQKADLKSICRILEKNIGSSSQTQIKESESPQSSDVAPLISHLRNLVETVKKDKKKNEASISKKKENITQLQAEKENLNVKLESQKSLNKEKEQAYRKDTELLSEKVNELNKIIMNLSTENGHLKRSLSDLQISYSNFQEMAKDKESVIYQKITMRMMNYCGLLHAKIAHLNLIKNMLWSFANIYLESSDAIIKLNSRFQERQELQDTIKSSSNTKEAKIAKKKKRQRVIRIVFKCVFFIGLLKVKKNTKLLLSQGIICNWITCASRTNLMEQIVDQYNTEELFKNPDKFIMSMNTNTDVLNFKDTKITITGNLRSQLLQLEQLYHKSTQSDRDQIDYFNKKIKEISAQMKVVVDSRQENEDRLKQQIFQNKSQQLTIQQLQGEVADLLFEVKLQNRRKSIHNQSRSPNYTNYLK